jgi:Glutaminase
MKMLIVRLVYLALFQSLLPSSELKADTSISESEMTEQFHALPNFSEADLGEHCFLRAHHWARQLEDSFGTRSYKAFVLFTPLMQHRKNLNWWYHVAPVVVVRDENNELVEMVIDKAFQSKPITMDLWLKSFSETGCVDGKGFADYDNQLIFGGCVVIRKPMYFFTPDDFHLQDPKSDWACSDMVKVRDYSINALNRPFSLMPTRCSR